MLKYSLLFIILFILFLTCTKNRFTSTPIVIFDSSDKKYINSGDSLILYFTFRDKEGDIAKIFKLRKRILNQNQPNSDYDIELKSPADVPESSNLTGSIKLELSYFEHIGSPLTFENDTVRFGLAIIDKANHMSDYAYTDTLIIVR